MSKVPCTQAGIDDLTADLYALTDPQLEAEADALLADWVGWVDDHVMLSAVQLSFLNGLDALFSCSWLPRAPSPCVTDGR